MTGRLSPLLRRGRELVKRIRAQGLILIYHRVTEGVSDPWRLSTAPRNFETQLQTLRKLGLRLVPIAQLAREVANGGTVRGTIALSFDDGYADNLDQARPLLVQYDVPATLFATSGYIGADNEFWWDTLERIFLQPGHLPPELTLDLPEGSRSWQLGPDRTWTSADAGRYASWKPFQKPPTRRHRAHDELWALLVTLEPTARSAAVARLLRWAETAATARPSHRTLTKDGLRAMARGDLIDIGAHSVTHPALASLPRHLRLGELVDSKAHLEAMLGRPVHGMSYPQGRSSREVQQEAREAGYAFACGSVYGAVNARSDLFHLPRVSVGDWDGERFATLLARHLPI